MSRSSIWVTGRGSVGMLVRRLVIASKNFLRQRSQRGSLSADNTVQVLAGLWLAALPVRSTCPKSMVWQYILSRILWDRVDRARSYLHTSPGTLLAWGRGKLQEKKRTMSGYTPIIVHGPHRVAGDSVARGALRETRRPGLALIPARTRAGSCAVGGRFWSGNSKQTRAYGGAVVQIRRRRRGICRAS